MVSRLTFGLDPFRRTARPFPATDAEGAKMQASDAMQRLSELGVSTIDEGIGRVSRGRTQEGWVVTVSVTSLKGLQRVIAALDGMIEHNFAKYDSQRGAHMFEQTQISIVVPEELKADYEAAMAKYGRRPIAHAGGPCE